MLFHHILFNLGSKGTTFINRRYGKEKASQSKKSKFAQTYPNQKVKEKLGLFLAALAFAGIGNYSDLLIPNVEQRIHQLGRRALCYQ